MYRAAVAGSTPRIFNPATFETKITPHLFGELSAGVSVPVPGTVRNAHLPDREQNTQI